MFFLNDDPRHWIYSEDPFPAFRCGLVFGRNKRDFKFLPVKDVRVEEDDNGKYVLPDHQFKVIKTREKGTILVVPGEEPTDRCLAFLGCSGGFRGGVNVLGEHSTGNIVQTCKASNATHSHVSVAVILDDNEKIAFHSFGRRTDQVIEYIWDAGHCNMIQTKYDKSEFDACYCDSSSDVDEL